MFLKFLRYKNYLFIWVCTFFVLVRCFAMEYLFIFRRLKLLKHNDYLSLVSIQECDANHRRATSSPTASEYSLIDALSGVRINVPWAIYVYDRLS